MSGIPNGLKNYLRVPFVMIVWVMETYTKNRERLTHFLAQPRVATTLKWTIVLTMLVWVVVGLMASEEDRGRLTDALKGFWSEAQDINEQKKQLNRQKDMQVWETPQ